MKRQRNQPHKLIPKKRNARRSVSEAQRKGFAKGQLSRPQRKPRAPGRPSHKRRSPRRLTVRQQDTRNRALRALGEMRRGASLAVASRAQGIKPSTVARYVGSQVRQDRPGGRVRVSKTDDLTRIVRVPGPHGPVLAVAKGSKAAREFSDYLNAVGAYGRTGNTSKLRPFAEKTYLTSTGERMPFMTDPQDLDELAEAVLLGIDQLYGTVKGGL